MNVVKLGYITIALIKQPLHLLHIAISIVLSVVLCTSSPFTMAPVNTIVFGATGSVGSAAAQTAKENSAEVFLAVRDLAKPLPNLTLEKENEQGFTRVQADLTQPDTLREAVTATKATRAFVYLAFGTQDNMKSSFQALKAAGIKFVVFLSTAGLRGDPRDAKPEDLIFFLHGQAEVNLEETFGKDGYVAIRPAFYASNVLWWKGMIEAGDVRVPYPQGTYDTIAPKDIGRVAGAALVEGPPILTGLTEKYNAITLFGPRLITQEKQVAIIGRVVGKEVKVTTVSEEEAVKVYSQAIPEAFARDVVSGSKVRAGLAEDDGFYAKDRFSAASGNVEKYGGKRPTEFEEWVEENKALFQ